MPEEFSREGLHHGQVARHVLVMRLDRASTDLNELCVPPQTLDVVLTNVAVATFVDLN